MGEPNQVCVLYCKHSDVTNLPGDITSHICSAIDKLFTNKAYGAHKISGVWIVAIRSAEVRESLLQTHIIINNK